MTEKLEAEQTEQDIFLGWMTEFQGKLWYDREKMDPDAYKLLHDYYHFRRNYSPDDPRALKAAEEFESLTGHSAKVFYDFREELNRGK